MSSRVFSFLLALASLAGVAHAQVGPGAPVTTPAPRLERDSDGRPWLFADLDLPTRGATPTERARSVLPQLAELDLDPSELVVEGVRRAHGLTVVRFGREVRVGGATLPVPHASVVVAMTGERARFVVDRSGARRVGPSDPVPPAGEAALQFAFGGDRAGAHVLGQREVALDLGGALHRLREVEVGRAMHERSLVYVGAHGVVFGQSRVHDAQGRVYDPNPPRAMNMTSDVELAHLTSRSFLTGRYVRAASCDPEAAGCEPVQRAMADEAGDFLYDPVEPAFDDEFAEVNAYFHTDAIAAYFREVHDLEWSCCESSSIIDVVANYVETRGEGYDNAFFLPPTCSRDECGVLAFGQGEEQDFGYDGDVIYHEYGHGIVDVTARYSIFLIDSSRGVYYDAGALNEATADYFAASFADDPKLGDYFASAGVGGAEGSLRDLAGDTRCPDDLFGEVHQDGVIWGQALWAVREALGQPKADALVFAALVASPADTDFPMAAEILITTADTLESLDASDRAAVRAIMDERGIGDCERIVAMEDERSYLGFSGIAQITGSLGSSVAPLLYRVDVPADATSLTVELGRLSLAGAYDLHFAVGAPPRSRFGGRPPLAADFSSSATTVTFDATSELPLPRCESLYIGLVATDLQSRGESVYTLVADLETSGDPAAECPPPPAPDLGVMDPDMGVAPDLGGAAGSVAGGGCGCRVAGNASGAGGGPSSAGGLASLLLLGLLAQRRRTRSMRRSEVSKKTVASAG